MKTDSIQETFPESKISAESKSSFIEFPFQLTEHNFNEKIEFIRNSLEGSGPIKEIDFTYEENCRRDFNSNFASLQSWFLRISHKEKLQFVLKLLEIFSVVLKRNTNSIIDILGPVSKDFIYAKTQFTFSKYDITPLDNNRCLSDIPLAEAKANSESWFSELEEKEQVRVMIILLNLSGSAITFHFYFKAVKYLDHRINDNLSLIEDKLKEYKFYNDLVDKNDPNEHQVSEISSDLSQTKNLDSHLTYRHSEAFKKVASLISTKSSVNWDSTMDYEHKLEEWEREFKQLIDVSGLLKPGTLNQIALPVIDMLQLLPISVNRYIYSLLDSKSKKNMKHINRYWYKTSTIMNKEEHTRHWLNQTISMLDFKLFKYKAKDWYTEVKYVNPKIRDKEQSLSDTEIRRKSIKSKSPQSADFAKRPKSSPVFFKPKYKPKYAIKMIPAPNHQYTKKYPENPYKGRFTISEICSRFDHTRCIAANFQWVAMSDKSNITLHSLLTGAPNPCQLIGHTGYITVLCFHPSKNCLFSGSCDTTIKYWDIYSRNVIDTYTNHKSLITDLNVNDNHLASVSMDQTLRIFKIESGSLIWQYLFSCSPMAVALGRKLEVYLGIEDGSVFKTDLESALAPVEWEITHAHGDRITCILFDEPFVITGGGDGFVRVWHFEHFDASAIATFNHNGMYVSGIALSYMKVLTTASDGILRIWDIYNSRLKRQIVVNTAKTPILSMVCLEIYDHTKVVINSEDSIKVIEFPYHWVTFNRACLTKENKEPKVIRGVKRITTVTPDDVLRFESQLRMRRKHRFEKRCRDYLLLRHAALPAVVKSSKGDKVTFKEVPIVSNALLNNNLHLFKRIVPTDQKIIPHVVKSELIDGGSKMISALWKYIPRSTKGVLAAYNPSKRTM